MVSKYCKFRNKSGRNNSIKPPQLYLRVFKPSNSNNIGNMPSGDNCAVSGCDNDRRYPEKQKILPQVGILRGYSPRNNNDVVSWARAINLGQFKVR